MEPRIEVSTVIRADFARVRAVLSDDPGTVFRHHPTSEAQQENW